MSGGGVSSSAMLPRTTVPESLVTVNEAATRLHECSRDDRVNKLAWRSVASALSFLAELLRVDNVRWRDGLERVAERRAEDDLVVARNRFMAVLPGGALHAMDGGGRSPLLAACHFGNLWTAVALLQAGAGLTSRDTDKRSVLHTAAAAVLQSASFEDAWDRMEPLEVLVRESVRRDLRLLESRDRWGNTPLLAAAALLPGPSEDRGHVSEHHGQTIGGSLLALMLETGADPFARNADNLGILENCMFSGDLQSAKMVLCHEASQGRLDSNAALPGMIMALLIRAAGGGEEELCEILISRDPSLVHAHEVSSSSADSNHAGSGGGGLWVTAMQRQAFAAVQHAPGYGEERPVLMGASHHQGLLHDATMDARAAAALGIVPSTHPDAATEADQAWRPEGADVLARFQEATSTVSSSIELGGSSRTALHVASASGHLGVVRLLIAAGAPLQAVDNRGSSPLHLAVAHGHDTVVQALIAAKADTSARDGWGRTPLEVVARRESQATLWSKVGTYLMDVAGPSDLSLGPVGGEDGAGIPMNMLREAITCLGADHGVRLPSSLSAVIPDRSVARALAAFASDPAAGALVDWEGRHASGMFEDASHETDTEEARRKWAKQGAQRAAKGLFSLFQSTWRRPELGVGKKRKGHRTVVLTDGAAFVEPPKGTALAAASENTFSVAPEEGYAADPIDEERRALAEWAGRIRCTPGEAFAAKLPPQGKLDQLTASIRAVILAVGACGWCSHDLSRELFPLPVVGLVEGGADHALLPIPAWVRSGIHARWYFRDTALPDLPLILAAGSGSLARGGTATVAASGAVRAAATKLERRDAFGSTPTESDGLGEGGLVALVQWIRSRTWPLSRAPTGPACDGPLGLAAAAEFQRMAALTVPAAATTASRQLSSYPVTPDRNEWAWNVFAKCPSLAMAIVSTDHVGIRSLGQLRVTGSSPKGRSHLEKSLARAQIPVWAVKCLLHHLEADLRVRLSTKVLNPAAVGIDAPGMDLPVLPAAALLPNAVSTRAAVVPVQQADTALPTKALAKRAVRVRGRRSSGMFQTADREADNAFFSQFPAPSRPATRVEKKSRREYAAARLGCASDTRQTRVLLGHPPLPFPDPRTVSPWRRGPVGDSRSSVSRSRLADERGAAILSSREPDSSEQQQQAQLVSEGYGLDMPSGMLLSISTNEWKDEEERFREMELDSPESFDGDSHASTWQGTTGWGATVAGMAPERPIMTPAAEQLRQGVPLFPHLHNPPSSS
jgi:ankyrin repeat protein